MSSEHLETAIEHLESAQSATRNGGNPIVDINQALAHLKSLRAEHREEAGG